MRKVILILLLILGLLCSPFTAHAALAAHSYTVTEVENLCGGIVAYKEAACGASSIQNLIDTALCADAGTTAEYYIITLSQSGSYDFSAYQKALLTYLDSNAVYSATTREKYALALIACGSSDSYIQQVCDNDIGGLGLMSLVFGLHLLNNGYNSALYSTDALIADILSRQLSDGGWAVIGSVGDVDVTAMTVQALAPYYGSRSDVTAAVDRALSLLSGLQLGSGGFVSMSAENCESAAQVLTALSSLGIDQNTDPRFIKNGRTVLDALLGYRNADGSFAHTGSGFNENATIQAFYAMRAYLRMCYGQTPFYILDKRPARSRPTTPTRSPGDTPRPTDEPPQSGAHDTDDGPAVRATEPGSEESLAPSESTRNYPTEPPHGDYISPTGSARFQPTGTTAPTATADEAPPSKGGYKLYAILGVLLAAGIVCLILLLRKKRGAKRYLAVLIRAAGAIVFILLTNFESRESYAQVEQKTDAAGAVTMTVRCDILADEDDLPLYIPDDGVILPPTSFTISSGETAYDILLEASKTYDIRIDNRGGPGSAYIAGIQYLYEYDYGELSGWMYRVNGVFPEVGCQSYVLADGDRIEWLYTKNIGKDLS